MVLALRRRGLAGAVHLRLLALIDDLLVRVSYLELLRAPAPAAARTGEERIALERPDTEAYLALYRQVGEQVRWDQRLQMTRAALTALLGSDSLHIHVLRNAEGIAIGLAEFDCSRATNVELKNFGIVPAAQGRGLGSWLLASALVAEWRGGATRIWLHTDAWDHPAALRLYTQAGFRLYEERMEPAGPL